MDDCCASLLVPGGTFFRDYDVANDGQWPDMSHPATVSDFKLDKYEVTVARFRAFLREGKGTAQNPPDPGAGAHARIPGSGWDAAWNQYLPADSQGLEVALACDASYSTWTHAPGPNDELPINCMGWYVAMAFCIWDGGYLPTYAEWNYAASGGSEQRAYPWSAPASSLTIDCDHTSYYESTLKCMSPHPVGTKPAGDGKWGQSDLGGNVSEWVLDWDTGLPNPSYIEPCDDCAKLTPDPGGLGRGTRGGDFMSSSAYARSADNVGEGEPAKYFPSQGVRCARPAP